MMTMMMMMMIACEKVGRKGQRARGNQIKSKRQDYGDVSARNNNSVYNNMQTL